MKISDYALKKDFTKKAEEEFNKLSPEQREQTILVTKGSHFIAGMICEVIDSDTVTVSKLPKERLAHILTNMIASGVALGLLRISSTSSDPEAFINYFKHCFELTITQFKDLGHDNYQ